MGGRWSGHKALKAGGYIALILGIGAVIGLVVYQGVGSVGAAIAALGWGFALVVLVRIVPVMLDAAAWRLLFDPDHRPRMRDVQWARWIGEGVNTLMPALQVGSALVRTRLMVLRGTPGRVAGASVVVDLTLSTLTQLLFTLVGIGFLLSHYGESNIAKGAGAGVGLGLVLVSLFCAVQHRGFFRRLVSVVGRVAKGRDWVNAVGGAEALDQAIRDIYRRKWILTANASGQMLAWVIGAFEVWLALHFMGYEISVADAMLLESLVLAVRAAAFFVPGALGVQEGALVLLGGVIGLSPDVALALSLIKRFRELVIGVPALFLWQVTEGRQLVRHHRERRAEGQMAGRPAVVEATVSAGGANPAERRHRRPDGTGERP